jgi:hypothetical protein
MQRYSVLMSGRWIGGRNAMGLAALMLGLAIYLGSGLAAANVILGVGA